MPPPVANEFDLLCEQCGYRLEGLDAAGVCPECGRAVAESLPQRRRGTPAQRSASPGALARTVWLALRSIRTPGVLWDAARVGDGADGRIKGLLLMLAAILVTAHWLFVKLMLAEPGAVIAEHGWWTLLVLALTLSAIYVPLGLMAAWPGLAVLTWLEKTGIRTFGRMHGRRITPAVAMTIVAHASAGWLVGAALLTPAWMAGRGLAAAADDVALLRWELVYMLPVILPTLAGLLGLLLFEVLTWQGVMRLRYANRERPGEDGPSEAAALPGTATNAEVSTGVGR